jgi:hypothetical protein
MYTFHRGDMWYPLDLKDGADAIANAECNPGTLRVERQPSRRVVWSVVKAATHAGGKA